MEGTWQYGMLHFAEGQREQNTRKMQEAINYMTKARKQLRELNEKVGGFDEQLQGWEEDLYHRLGILRHYRESERFWRELEASDRWGW